MESDFLDWFIAQHGRREQSPGTDQMLRVLVQRGEEARAELARREEWDARQASALYAWQARGKKEPTA